MARSSLTIVTLFLLGSGAGCVSSAARDIYENGGSVVNFGAPILLPHCDVHFDAREKTITDEDFRRLFPSIRRLRPYGLNLEDADIGDESLQYVRKLPTLVFLYVDGTRVTAEGLRQLKGMKNLEGIWLSAHDFTEEEAAALQRDLDGVEIERRYKRDHRWFSETELRHLYPDSLPPGGGVQHR